MPTLTGTPGDDELWGGELDDVADGGDGNDQILGGGGNDDLAGDAGSDTIYGGNGKDWIYSGTRSPAFAMPSFYSSVLILPVLDTGAEFDMLLGDDEADTLFAGYGDSVDGGYGAPGYTDRLYLSLLGAPSGVTADFRQPTVTIGNGTITRIEHYGFIQGSNYDDKITAGGGTTGNQHYTVVYGMGGNDELVADYWTGILDGGDGDDLLDGRGAEYMMRVSGGAGDDTIRMREYYARGVAEGGDGNDTIYGWGEVQGGDGDDTIYRGTKVDAGGGNDVIFAFDYAMDLLGGDGDDFFISGAEYDTYDGGAGVDTIDYRNSAYGAILNLALIAGETGTGFDKVKNVENVNGSSLGDTLNGSDQANFLEGFAGGDTLNGNGGDDKLSGGFGDDSMTGGLGNDQFLVHDAGDQVFEGADQGIDEVLASVSWTLTAGQHVERLVLFGDLSAPLNLTGNELANQLVGNAAANVLNGGAGADSLAGGSGNDTYVIDNIGDTVSEAADEGIDTVEASLGHTLDANVENLILTGSAALDGTGNAAANVLTGNSGANALDGGAGNDALGGGDGQDWLQGGEGDDGESGGTGHDSVWGGIGNDYLDGGEGDDTIVGDEGIDTVTYAFAGSGVEVDLSWLEEQDTRGAGWDTLVSIEGLVGSAFDDRLTGDGAANALRAGAGADVLTGGGGNDAFHFGDNDSTPAAPDVIADFAPGDLIVLYWIDADTGTGGDQAFHLGATAGHTGDVVLAFDAANDRTSLSLYVDGDAIADGLIWLTGDHTALTGADFVL